MDDNIYTYTKVVKHLDFHFKIGALIYTEPHYISKIYIRPTNYSLIIELDFILHYYYGLLPTRTGIQFLKSSFLTYNTPKCTKKYGGTFNNPPKVRIEIENPKKSEFEYYNCMIKGECKQNNLEEDNIEFLV